MRFFKLPDLGEGIPEAEIVEWHVREGETVCEDQVIVSMETAKAVVEVPSPCAGVVIRQFGQPGDLIHTGEPLVEFEGDDTDTGTVVGSITEASAAEQDDEEHFFIGASPSTSKVQQMVRPAINHLVRNLQESASNISLENGEPLKGVRREMARSMTRSGHEVVSVTLFADADIHEWQNQSDLTVKVLMAVVDACRQEPALNAWFDGPGEKRQLMDDVNVGLAVDSPHGLLVPVLERAQSFSPDLLRTEINRLKNGVMNRELALESFQGATISVSNFGALGTGRYATPVVVPPAVAILGVGSVGDQVVACNGQAVVHRVMSLSLSFDHRAVTGGEASRFLRAVVQHIEKKQA
ncbi:2-oxo acid dehydrogenase subunit E2 [Sansalvadorimonas sp. 2012CJ34-2]|uniref:Dihydrolipoamide acetyltransferase component of pyruvate dehydrogenase complex n=1 Tax=Parendozoicomonas callyspongiae TaxID=2942213 RepID=A0ABT0PGX2_9GAMM|nr:dihydrolipoamide acetyltransferase family protein [Sansalvadorimonas sp. 2012CJ34-2]MCL6269758.1 2-oxo acid dehydrogenase subunit E2 [Sansalvadorimonas sp. 2012CJ34-2]